MNRITINILRRIAYLDFEIPECKYGVFLLTGANGAGKSTLLSCLARLGDNDALQRFFSPNIKFSDADAPPNILTKALIGYSSSAGKVEYRFDGEKWLSSETPEKEKEILDAFGYPQTIFTGAKPKRLPREGEVFHTKDIIPSSNFVREATLTVFDDDRFKDLAKITSSISGEDIYLREENIGGIKYYFSENNFSSGERAVIKLADAIDKIAHNSLVLIDEAEMALHPKAQKRLMMFLESAAREKALTIIVSTQSASLIKIADPRMLLFLQTDEKGRMECRSDVYPAAVLGEMAFEEEILPDTVLLVEDAEAAMLLEAIVGKLKSVMRDVDFPYCKILPVGGYMQVVILLDNLSKVFPNFVKRRAVLDKDAEHNVSRAAHDIHRAHHDVCARNYHRIYFLPCAPEQGVVTLLEHDPKYHSGELERIFGTRVRLLDAMRGVDKYRFTRGDSRADCKEKLTVIANYLVALTGETEHFVRKKLYRYYVEKHYHDIKRLKDEYCPLIFKR